jgi:dihydrofolate reductase
VSRTSRVRVYVGCSLDGFIAGPDGDIAWLMRDHAKPGDLPADARAVKFATFMSGIGALLMGRTSYDVVAEMGAWPYGETPVLVATHRPLTPTVPTVRAVSGSIDEVIAKAKALSGNRDVYLDGGNLVRQALDAGLVDDMTLTLVPVLLARGTRLFEGLARETQFQFSAHHAYEGGLLQLTVRIPKPAR